MDFVGVTTHRIVRVAILAMLFAGVVAVAQTKNQKNTPAKAETFGGSYETLLPGQKKLVDDYFQRAGAAIGKKIDPAKGYDSLRLSVRSTFDAVTHALSRTQLTDKDGKKYGTALDLVELVEDVAGERKGAGGDEQFRIYAILRFDAYDILSKVKQFQREHDNTIYHKGYPICFRSIPAVPSIQFSITRDHKHADIDVDYRSSKFPSAVVNGHLTASNSDVRAGDNLQRHDSQWTGLAAWWQNLFGLSPSESKSDISLAESGIPVAPKGDPDLLTHDLLTAWLVQQNIPAAGSYFSHQVYPCAEAAARKQGRKVSAGIGQFLLLVQLANGAKAVGKAENLAAVVSAPDNPYNNLTPLKNKYPSEFLLLPVPADMADEFRCKAAKEKERAGDSGAAQYVGSLIRIRPPKASEVVLMLLWAKESNKYRIVSARLVEEAEAGLEAYGAKTPPSPEAPPLPTVDGDAQLNTTLDSFFNTWLVKDNAAKAATFYSPVSYACLPPEQISQGSKALVAGLSSIRTSVGARNSLQDYLKAVVPDDPSLKQVIHTNYSSYAIVLVPGSEAQTMSCSKSKKLPEDATYYGTVYRFRTKDGNDPATVYMLWSKLNNTWKVVSWKVISVD
jgi:hypothetical protein